MRRPIAARRKEKKLEMCAQLPTNQADPWQGWKSPISPICPIAAGKGSWKMCVEPNQPTSSRWQGWKSPTRAALRSGSALFSSWILLTLIPNA